MKGEESKRGDGARHGLSRKARSGLAAVEKTVGYTNIGMLLALPLYVQQAARLHYQCPDGCEPERSAHAHSQQND